MEEDEIIFSKEKDFPYKTCELVEINLHKHYEYPQDITWSQPRISPNGKYIGAKSSRCDRTSETVYIWETSNPNKHIFSYLERIILTFDFSANSKSFIIIYGENKRPIHYNIKTGHPIVSLDTKKVPINECLSWSFSNQCKYYALATTDHFFIWDFDSGILKCDFIEKSPKKFIRARTLYTIDDECYLNMIIFPEHKKKERIKINNMTNCKEVLYCMLSEDEKVIYYGTRNGIYKVIIEDKLCERVINFDCNDIEYVGISNDCKLYFSTNLIDVTFWHERKGKCGVFSRQKFNYILISIQSNYIIIIDDYSMTFFDYAFYGKERDIFKVYFDTYPNKFTKIEYSLNGLYTLCRINEYSAILYETETGIILHKFKNKIPHFQKCLTFSPESSENAALSVKINEQLIQVYDYTKGIPVTDLKGINSFEVKFNDKGNLIVAGGVKGEECARVWDIDYPDKPSIFYNSEQPNINTSVVFNSDSSLLICLSEKQDPIIFNVNNGEEVIRCKTDIKFWNVDSLFCSYNSKYLISYGSSGKHIKVAIIWDMLKGKKIKILNKAKSLDISDNKLYMISLCDNTLTIWSFKDEIEIIKEIKSIGKEHFRILKESKLYIQFAANREIKEYIFRLCNIMNGEILAELNYVQNTEDKFYLDITKNDTDIIILRKLSFIQN